MGIFHHLSLHSPFASWEIAFLVTISYFAYKLCIITKEQQHRRILSSLQLDSEASLLSSSSRLSPKFCSFPRSSSFCFALHCTASHRIASSHIVSHRITLYHIASHRTSLSSIWLCDGKCRTSSHPSSSMPNILRSLYKGFV